MMIEARDGDSVTYTKCEDSACPDMKPGTNHAHAVKVERETPRTVKSRVFEIGDGEMWPQATLDSLVGQPRNVYVAEGAASGFALGTVTAAEITDGWVVLTVRLDVERATLSELLNADPLA